PKASHGNFSFVRTDQGDDPPVYTHLEQNPGRTFCSCSRYSDYLALVVEQCAGIEPIELIESLVFARRAGKAARRLSATAEVSRLRARHFSSGRPPRGLAPPRTASVRK